MKKFYILFILLFLFKNHKSLNVDNNFHIINNKNNLLSISEIKNNVLKENSNQNKNLLIGVFSKLKWEEVALFFKSFQKANFQNCDLVIFVDKIAIRTIKQIKSCGFTLYQIPDELKKLSIEIIRWKIYEYYLNNNSGKYNLIFAADIKKVIFQQDIFKQYEGKKSFLGVSLDEGTLDEKNNKKWIINAYGEEIYNTMKNERIISTLTIWGTEDKFKEFCKIMWEKLSSNSSISNKIKIVDQAVANYIIYHNKLFKDCLIKSDKNGPVINIGLIDRKDILLDNNNNILNMKNEIASVVSQYESKRDILKIVRKKYCPELDKLIESNNIIFFIFAFIAFIFIFITYIKNRKETQNIELEEGK